MIRLFVAVGVLVVTAACVGPSVEPDGGVAIDAGNPLDDAGTTGPDGGSDGGSNDAGVCAATTGLLTNQSLTVDGVERAYLLYYPPRLRCPSSPLPLFLDFHGSYGGDARPEEVYTLEGAIAAADEKGFVLARLRATPTLRNGRNVYFWESLSPTETLSHLEFARALVENLTGRLPIDPQRVYALGFSSGTQPALRLALAPNPIVRGSAIIGGGYWSAFTLPPSLTDAPRLYVSTGYRDLHFPLGVPPLVAALSARGYPMERLALRPSMLSHSLESWHYLEAFDALDQPAAANPAPLAAPWHQLDGGQDTTLSVDSTGTLRGGLGVAWADGAPLPGLPAWAPVTGLCRTPMGTIVAALNDRIARRPVGASTWTLTPVPLDAATGARLAVDVACLPNGRVVAAGYQGLVSEDDGVSFTRTPIEIPGYGPQLVNRLHVTASGAVVAAGAYLLARSTDGRAFQYVGGAGTYFALTSRGSTVWAMGAAGAMEVSSDDGQTFASAPLATALAFLDVVALPGQGVFGVGMRGLTASSSDEGQHFTVGNVGRPLMLSAARASSAGVRVWGEAGFTAERTIP